METIGLVAITVWMSPAVGMTLVISVNTWSMVASLFGR